MSEIEWADAEREAVRDELSGSPIGGGYYTTQVGTDEARDMADEVLDTLAPFVAAREAQARVDALREAAKEWQWGGWSDDLPPKGHSRPQLILGMAQKATSWLRAEADRIERGDR